MTDEIWLINENEDGSGRWYRHRGDWEKSPHYAGVKYERTHAESCARVVDGHPTRFVREGTELRDLCDRLGLDPEEGTNVDTMAGAIRAHFGADRKPDHYLLSTDEECEMHNSLKDAKQSKADYLREDPDMDVRIEEVWLRTPPPQLQKPVAWRGTNLGGYQHWTADPREAGKWSEWGWTVEPLAPIATPKPAEQSPAVQASMAHFWHRIREERTRKSQDQCEVHYHLMGDGKCTCNQRDPAEATDNQKTIDMLDGWLEEPSGDPPPETEPVQMREAPAEPDHVREARRLHIAGWVTHDWHMGDMPCIQRSGFVGPVSYEVWNALRAIQRGEKL